MEQQHFHRLEEVTKGSGVGAQLGWCGNLSMSTLAARDGR